VNSVLGDGAFPTRLPGAGPRPSFQPRDPVVHSRPLDGLGIHGYQPDSDTAYAPNRPSRCSGPRKNRLPTVTGQ